MTTARGVKKSAKRDTGRRPPKLDMDAIYRATRPLMLTDIGGYVLVMEAFRSVCRAFGDTKGATLALMALHSAAMVTGPPHRQRRLGYMLLREAPSGTVLMAVGSAEEDCGHLRAAARCYREAKAMALTAGDSDLAHLLDVKLQRLSERKPSS